MRNLLLDDFTGRKSWLPQEGEARMSDEAVWASD